MFEHELKNAYIGEYIEEVFTMAKIEGTSSSVYSYLTIAKSWFTVKQVTIETEGKSNNTSYSWNINCWIRANNNSWNGYRFAWWVGQNNYFKIEYTDGSYHDIRTWLQWGSTSWLNTIKLVIGKDEWSITLNWTKTTWTNTATEKTIIQGIFNSGTICSRIQTVRGYIWPATITVIYEKI